MFAVLRTRPGKMRRGRADSVCVCGVRGGGDRSLNAYLQWKEIVKLSKEH